MRLRKRFLFSLMGAVLFAPSHSSSQEVVIPSKVTCVDCQITLTRLPIGHGGRLAVTNLPSSIARAADGGFFIVNPFTRLAQHIRRDGTVIRTYGQIGPGARQYQAVSKILVGSDGLLHLLDAAQERHTILKTDGTVLRTAPLRSGRGIFDAVLLPDGHLVTNSMLTDEDAAGFPLQEFDTTGKLVRLFGGEQIAILGNYSWWSRRHLLARPDGSIWVARPFEYRLELYVRGRKEKEFYRHADWFPALPLKAEASDGLGIDPPTPVLSGMWQDSTGLLWTITNVASPRWRLGGPTETRYNTVVEVLDLARGSVVARARVQPTLLLAMSDGLVVAYIEGDGSHQAIELWQVELKRRSRKSNTH